MGEFASGGDDYLDGGDGDDTIVGDALNFSTLPVRRRPPPTGSGGADTLIGGNGDDLLIGDAVGCHRTASASGGDDRLSGGDGNDTARIGDAHASGDNGRGGNDRLFGEAGDDVLHSGGGAFDIMDGGDGVDTVVFDGNRADFASRDRPAAANSSWARSRLASTTCERMSSS